MSSSTFTFEILGLVPCFLMLLYSAYKALDIRRAFAVGLYRNQALGIGLVSIAVAATQTGVTIFSGASFVVQLAFPVFAIMTILFWTDSSMRTGRRTDPLLRDTLHWSKFRMFLIGIIVVVAIATIASGSYVSYVWVALVVIPLTTCAIVLPVMGRRSGYKALRRQLLWFGLFALSILVITVSIGGIILGGPSLVIPLYSLLAQDAGVALGGYCLYRSAISLAPINRLSN